MRGQTHPKSPENFMKHAKSNTDSNTDPKHRNEAVPTPGKSPPREKHRAEPGSSAQRDNQQKLGVGADHRTEDMKRGHRGTFP